jgi:hemerythrin superfamily protein
MPNGIDLILEDHRYVEQLFADVGDTRDAGAIGQILDALTAHDDAEHAALYPLAGEVLGDAELIMSMDAAHSAIKKQMEHLRALEGPVLVEELKRLQSLVEQHVSDEENQLFPALGDRATPAQLEWLGARILDTKQRVG